MEPYAISAQELLSASRILIIDDSEFNRFLLRQVFENNGFHHIFFASNGKQALENLATVNPQLILLDLMMPEMDGYEFCRHLRAMPAYRDIPVLVQTAVESQEERNRIFTLGATDLVTKPVNAEEVMARARVHLEKQHLLSDLQRYHVRIASELVHAREMQNDLLPDKRLILQCRKTYSLDIASHFETPSEMGGDMWGIKPMGNHQLIIFMSDLTGHGVTAALNAFRLHTLMQELPMAFGINAGGFLGALGERLCALLGKAQFATMFYGIMDIQRDTLHYATAATPTPLLLRHGTNRFEKLDGRGYPLAIRHNQRYPTQTVAFEKGDVLILLSDAFTETHWRGGEFMSEDMLISYLEDALSNGLPPSAVSLRDAILDYFRADAVPITDDLTLSIYHRL